MGNAAAIAAAFGGGLPPGISGTNDRCTILVSNLNPDVSSLSLSHTHGRACTKSAFEFLLLLFVISENRRG